jgi:DNA-binding NarL/FixJ family response regulator
MIPKQNILLATDRPLLSRKFESLLTAVGLSPEHQVLHIAALTNRLRSEHYDLVMIAAEPSPDVDALAEFRSIAPAARFVVWCRRVTPQLVQAAIESGCYGVLSRRLPFEEAAIVFSRIYEGERQFRFDSDQEVDKLRDPRLSHREHLVAALVISGQKYREIADFLRISEGSVKVCLNRLFWKIGARNREELKHLAPGLIDPYEPMPAKPVKRTQERPFDNLWMFLDERTGQQKEERAMLEIKVTDQQLFDMIMGLHSVRANEMHPEARHRLDLLLDNLHSTFDSEVMPGTKAPTEVNGSSAIDVLNHRANQLEIREHI